MVRIKEEARGSIPATLPPQAGTGWVGRAAFPLGKEQCKGVFGAELFAIHRAMRILERQETGVEYTIFLDSTAAIEQVMMDRCGVGQALARAVIELKGVLGSRNCSVTLRWTPAHRGVEGNETAGSYAKWTAKSPRDSVNQEYLRGKSCLPHSKDYGGQIPANEGVGPRACEGQAAVPNPQGRIRKDLQKGKKALA